MGKELSVREIAVCRACGHDRLETVLDLGNLCISDFVELGQEGDRAPLALALCRDCGLAQLRHTVDRDRLYRQYHYRSGVNEAMVAALRDVVEDACRRVKLGSGDVVLDVGANDGTLLRQYEGRGLRRVGFEPAAGFRADLSWMRPGDSWVSTYFPGPEWVERQPAKVISSIAMFYDMDNPSGFVQAIKERLHPEGVWVLQMPDLWTMLSRNAFDNICHEHLCYWPTRTLYRFLLRHGLKIEAMSNNAVNGGSVRYIVRHAPAKEWDESDATRSYQDYARAVRELGERVERLRQDTRGLLRQLKQQGKRVWGYGASTKGNTLLQHYGIGTELVEGIAERAPEKWGRYTVGTQIPIVSEEEMRRERPDYLLALPWHFAEGFRRREAAWEAAGGRWIVPLPELRVIGGEGHAGGLAQPFEADARA